MLKATTNSPVKSGNQTINSGNLVIGTAGNGVDFSANTHAAGMTSELLDWYEEGTWTPSAGANLTVSGVFSSSGTYTRVGRQVTIIGVLIGSTSVEVVAGGAMCGNLPFTVSGFGLGNLAVFGAGVTGTVFAFSSSLISQTAVSPIAEIYFSATYFV
jgi:hypothetical protein